MNVSVAIDVRIHDPSSALKQELTTALWIIGLQIQRETQIRTPFSTGILRASILSTEPREMPQGLQVVVGTSVPYSTVVEFGRSPNSRMPPPSAIADWLRIKHRLSEEQALKLAWPVARGIAKRGTKGKFMFTNAMNTVEPMIDDIVNAAIQRGLGK